jgi:hypothetical protein
MPRIPTHPFASEPKSTRELLGQQSVQDTLAQIGLRPRGRFPGVCLVGALPQRAAFEPIRSYGPKMSFEDGSTYVGGMGVFGLPGPLSL